MWTEHELETREDLIRYFTRYLELELRKINSAFHFIRIETPVMYKGKLRQGTIEATCDEAEILKQQTPKHNFPFVVWQHGKVFRTRKEVYTLEYQILFSKTTGARYFPKVLRSSTAMMRKQCGKVFVADENANGVSIFTHDTDQELARILETDFWGGKAIEIVIFMDAVTKVNIQHEFGKIRRALPIDKR